MPSALTLTGLNFGFLIGMMTGLLSFIPFVGAATGFLVAAVVAIAQFWPDWTSILDGGRRVPVGQVLEGYVLSPKLVGAKVGLHPVWMMFALIAFGYLFGFVGLAGRHPACGDDRRAASLCAPQISRKPDLHRRSGPR